ncbi:hypothetical protein B0T18DRAFT_141173 [Schizothecium vesticola]|uniref:Uncharacterized protein n=1 Tax=Schizothecium vesticola TaxID=314040 RepID=A0AA40EUV8_9PEZI|nr:hypothetical protein B0T18DRAFT_141173 [Schizothecium vesticola]
MSPADSPNPLGGGGQQQDDASPPPNGVASPASSSSPALAPAPAPAPATSGSVVDNLTQALRDLARGPRSSSSSSSRGLACTLPLLRSEWTCQRGGGGRGEVPWPCRRRRGLCRVEPLSAVVVSFRRAKADERETWATQIGLFVSCHGVWPAQWQARETLGTAEPSHPFAMSLAGGRVCNHVYLDPSRPLTPAAVIGRRVYMPSSGSTAVHCPQEGEAKANLPSTNRGEQTAAALEANLSALESKLDDMLALLDTAAEEGNGVGAALALLDTDDEDQPAANGDSEQTGQGQ